MSPSARYVGRRLLVWPFATLAAAQTTAAFIIAAHDGRTFAATVWAFTTVFSLVVAVSMESVKQFLEGSFG